MRGFEPREGAECADASRAGIPLPRHLPNTRQHCETVFHALPAASMHFRSSLGARTTVNRGSVRGVFQAVFEEGFTVPGPHDLGQSTSVPNDEYCVHKATARW
jgi:hypothetical protein